MWCVSTGLTSPSTRLSSRPLPPPLLPPPQRMSERACLRGRLSESCAHFVLSCSTTPTSGEPTVAAAASSVAPRVKYALPLVVLVSFCFVACVCECIPVRVHCTTRLTKAGV